MGFIARFAFIAPPPDSIPSNAPFPDEPFSIPEDLTMPLLNWHHGLGSPLAEIVERTSESGQFLGYRIERTPLTLQTCKMREYAQRCYYEYNTVLMDMVKQYHLEQLAGNYGRLAKKALRMAMFFASLENDGNIELRHWVRAQHIAEEWRASLHEIYEQVNESLPSKDVEVENEIMKVIKTYTAKFGQSPTAREIRQRRPSLSAKTIQETLRHLTRLHIVQEIHTTQTYRDQIVENEA